MSRIKRTAMASCCMCAWLLATPGATWAQQSSQTAAADEASLGEVVVTAQRRAENVQTVPVAVTTISSEQMQQFHIQDSRAAVQFVPNMFGSSNTGIGSANTYFIRGLGNVESIATFDPPVATYVDDIPLARQNANNFSLFDPDHIEVLSGPQGTLFGRNTTGGAVSITMKKPATEMGGFVEASTGSYNMHGFRGSVDIPVSSTVLTKISGFYQSDDGFNHDTLTNQTLNGNTEKGLRGAIRWLPADNLTWDLSADWIDQAYANIYSIITADKRRLSETGLNNNYSVYPGLFAGAKGNYPQESLAESHSITSNVAWSSAAGTLNFITGWRDLTNRLYEDFFNSPLPVTENGGAIGVQFIIATEERHQQFTQELKFDGAAFADRLTYVTGLFYLNEMNTSDLGQTSLLPGGIVPDGQCEPDISVLCSFQSRATGNYVTILEPYMYDRNIYSVTHSLAAYGQADYKILDALTATLGGRYTRENKSIEFNPNPNPLAATVNQFDTGDVAAAGIPVQQSIKILTPRVALRYDFTKDLNMYVSATRGFRGGGWDARSSTADLALAFAPEKTWSYEMGLRSEWLDHKLRANVTGFYADTQNFQLPTAYQPAGGGGVVFITGNYASLTVHGIQAELAAAPTEGLQIFGNIGWQQGTYYNLAGSVIQQQHNCLAEIAGETASKPDCGAGIINPFGQIASPTHLPTHSIKAGAVYRVHLGYVDLIPSANIENSGSYDTDAANPSPGTRQHAYTMLNAGLRLEEATAGRHSWSVQANCSNCTDRTVVSGSLPPTLYFQDPRRWDLTFGYQF